MQTVSPDCGFDPSVGLFIAQQARPAALEPVAIRSLSPLQRALLVIDGTVTTFLEAWALERIRVERLWQHAAVLAAADPWLDAAAGASVLNRAVLLTGSRSGSLYAFAESVICPDRLPEQMRRELDAGTAGLGQILLAGGFDSRREGLWYGLERPSRLPEPLHRFDGREFLSRTYRVTTAGRPLMLITERFPWQPAIVCTGTDQPGEQP